MNPGKAPGRNQPRADRSDQAQGAVARKLSSADTISLVLGCFLGLSLIKFGNPVVLDSKIDAPVSLAEFRAFAWPPSWAVWTMLVIGVLGGSFLVFKRLPPWPGSKWLWVLPLVWIGWQVLATITTVDRSLSVLALGQLAGCVIAYFLGARFVAGDRQLKFLLAGLIAALGFSLVRAVDQRLVEFPQERQFLVESQQMNWTNVPPALLAEMQEHGVVIHTNGMLMPNPAILSKYERARVHGTLVYPNALAGAILLLFPAGLVLVLQSTQRFRIATRLAAAGLMLFLGGASLFWTGSKSGWLIAVAAAGMCIFRLNWSKRLKWAIAGVVILAGVVLFLVRFQSYLSAGAQSVGARFDYWQAAVKISVAHPLAGTGPGTFQRPYELIKTADSEMTRLVHNDYLEQFSDSGIVGGVSYAVWIALLLLTLAKRTWGTPEALRFAVFSGLVAWFAQGLSEFSLYVPALAWTAFMLAGALLSVSGGPSGYSDTALSARRAEERAR